MRSFFASFSSLPSPLRNAKATFAAGTLACAAVFGLPCISHAQVVLLSNLDAAPSTNAVRGTTIGNGGLPFKKAVAFTTGTGTATINSLQIYLSLESYVLAGSTAQVSFALYTPSVPDGSDPGALVANFGAQSVTNAYTTPSIYTYTLGSAASLTANTRYVLYTSGVTGADATWSYASPNVVPTARNSSGFNSVQYRLSSDGVTFSNSGLSNLFALNGTATPAAAAPEPATLALISAAATISGLPAFVRRRRRSNRNA